MFPEDVDLNEKSLAEELSGKLSKQDQEDKLMHSVLQNDKKLIDDGKLLAESIDRNSGSFHPDLMMEQMARNFSLTKKLYGPTIIKGLTGYDESYIEKNISIPEFQRELLQRMQEKISQLKEQRVVSKEGFLTEEGTKLAGLVLYMEELDNLTQFKGERENKRLDTQGDIQDVRAYRKYDTYKQLALQQSIALAIRRGHNTLTASDLRTSLRASTHQASIIIALDASGSMRGTKISTCKKAAIALAFKAIHMKDKVGLIVFGEQVRAALHPTNDFKELLLTITQVRPTKQTDFHGMIEKATELFPPHDHLKHLVLLTDALPTLGKQPEERTIRAAEKAVHHGITLSVVGINLDKQGKRLGLQMTQTGNGRLYMVKKLAELDKLVLEDYALTKKA